MDRFGHAFDRLETAGKGNYESHMTSKTEIGEHSRREAIFEAKKAHSLLVSTANRPTRLFILSAIEETWVSYLEGANAYFNCVSAKALLKHLVDNCKDLGNTNSIKIRLTMPSWWGQ